MLLIIIRADQAWKMFDVREDIVNKELLDTFAGAVIGIAAGTFIINAGTLVADSFEAEAAASCPLVDYVGDPHAPDAIQLWCDDGYVFELHAVRPGHIYAMNAKGGKHVVQRLEFRTNGDVLVTHDTVGHAGANKPMVTTRNIFTQGTFQSRPQG